MVVISGPVLSPITWFADKAQRIVSQSGHPAGNSRGLALARGREE